jgi:GT2 family glycosyltransferase
MKKTAAVILTYNNSGMLESLLKQLQSQTLKPSEIIVIDNASTDDTQTRVKSFFPGIRYIRMPFNKGSAGGYYEGIKVACEEHDAVWLLDDDVLISPNALEELLAWLERLQRSNKIGAVRSWCSQDCPFKGVRQTNSFAWRGTLIKKQAIEKIGLPNPDYFLYGDDIEYAFRLRKSGYSVFWVASSRVIEQRHFDKNRLFLLGSKITVYKDNAKLYYTFRNYTFFFIAYRLWWQLMRNFLYAAKLIVLLLLSGQKQKGKAIAAIFSGIKDGFARKLGICEQYKL